MNVGACGVVEPPDVVEPGAVVETLEVETVEVPFEKVVWLEEFPVGVIPGKFGNGMGI